MRETFTDQTPHASGTQHNATKTLTDTQAVEEDASDVCREGWAR